MANPYSLDDLLEFLDHAGDRGIIPAATVAALAVATRSVLGVLSDEEKRDLSSDDLDSIVHRFQNRRAGEFSPSTLKEYGRRFHRAVRLYQDWREDPANFSVPTRNTSARKGRRKGGARRTGKRGEGGRKRGGNGRTGDARERDTIVAAVADPSADVGTQNAASEAAAPSGAPGTYSSAIPVRPGMVVTLLNVPHDLTSAEAERLADFVRMLVVER